MSILLLGLFLFLGMHVISIVNDPWRNQMAERLGEWTWKGIYSVVSIVGFVLVILGYGIARHDSIELYSPPIWLQHISLLVMLPAFPLLVAAYFPGRIKKLTQHPMLLATMLWAIAHLLANGDLVDVLLFGSFLVWAIWDRLSFSHRQQRPLPGAPPSGVNDIIACVVGFGLYLVFILWVHERIIGVPVY